MMHLLIGAKPGLLNTFFSLVKKRLCSPGLKHCLNVEAVVLCTLGIGEALDAFSTWKSVGWNRFQRDRALDNHNI